MAAAGVLEKEFQSIIVRYRYQTTLPKNFFQDQVLSLMKHKGAALVVITPSLPVSDPSVKPQTESPRYIDREKSKGRQAEITCWGIEESMESLRLLQGGTEETAEEHPRTPTLAMSWSYGQCYGPREMCSCLCIYIYL